MLRTSLIFLMFLLSFSHYITCDEWDDAIKDTLLFLSERTGSCSEYFEYRRTDDFINGKLTLPHLAIGDTVKMTFYQSTLTFFPGILLPDGSSQDVINRLQKKQLISFRVELAVAADVPELYKIFINGNELCKTRFDKSFDEILSLEHTLDLINGSLEVFTYNINIPHFAKTPTNCGVVDGEITSPGGIPLAYGGKVINRGEYPWLTAIYRKHLTGLNFVCGGSLVTSKIILSAAHCFQSLSLTADKITAMLGRYNFTNYGEDGYSIHEIEAMTLHPDYKPGLGFSDADLALIEMKEHVSFTKYIKPICVWNGPDDESRIVNQTGVVVGWGSDENGNSISVAPKKVNVNIVSGEECLRSSLAFNAFTSSRTLCAGNRDGSGPCEGDSGGGLVINQNGVWMLRGIVSLALTVRHRCDLTEYTVYCDIAKHMTWLQNYIQQEYPPITGSIEDICGRSGTKSRIGHPWLASIYLKFPTGLAVICAGSIVSSRSVLAQANCFTFENLDQAKPYLIRVYLGRYDLNNINENGVVLRNVAAIIYHPQFRTSSHKIADNNIALLQMKDPISFTEYVKPICLWTEPMDQSQIVGQSATVVRWEQTKVHNKISTVPMSIDVNISSFEECQMLEYNVSTSSRMLCVTGQTNNFAGILMLKRNGRWLLRGVSTWTYNNFSPSIKNVCLYNDIAEYVSWIQSNLLS